MDNENQRQYVGSQPIHSVVGTDGDKCLMTATPVHSDTGYWYYRIEFDRLETPRMRAEHKDGMAKIAVESERLRVAKDAIAKIIESERLRVSKDTIAKIALQSNEELNDAMESLTLND